MKMKQLVANMQGQVITILKPFLNFMFSFKPTKGHNMVTFMLNPSFKDLSLVLDYVGHSSLIKITNAYDKEFLLPTLKTLY